MARVVLAQNDLRGRRERGAALRRAGFEVAPCSFVQEAVRLIDSAACDAAVVAPNGELPKLEEVCRTIGSESPVLVVAQEPDTRDVVELLRAGADVVREPVPERELVARVEALVRRINGVSPEPSLVVGGVTIDRAAKRVYIGDDEVELTSIERDLLLVLAEEPRNVFSRERLLEDVWGLGFGAKTTCLTQTIKRLRRKLQDCSSDPRVIVTVRGWGYRLGDR